MKIFTTKNNYLKIFGIFFWLIIWYIISQFIDEKIILVSPLDVLLKLKNLVTEPKFYFSIFVSYKNILIGFFSGTLVGVFAAIVSFKNQLFKYIMLPINAVINSVPIVSFIILSLFFISSKNLSIFISFLMTMPIIFTNVLEGLLNTDKKLLEMAKVFKVNSFKQVIYIYVAQIFPFFVSASKIALGLSSKSGIAAEVIGLPKNTIGEKLYNSKIYLNTDELFAWTIVIVIVSFLFEKIIMFVLNKIMIKLQRI